MAYRLRYVMQFNAREAMHLIELRSSPQGHPAYRRIALEMHRLIAEQAGHRAVAEAMTHLTTEAPELERLEAERRAAGRRSPGRVTAVTKTGEQPGAHRRVGSARVSPRWCHDEAGERARDGC